MADVALFFIFAGVICQWKWFAREVAKFILLVRHYMENPNAE